jgi:hypothetical protein
MGLPICAKARSSTRIRSAAVLVSLLLATASACVPRFVSSYDEITDRSATELQKKIEGFVHKMVANAGKPEGQYSKNAAFYDEARTDLSAIRVRAKAFDKNERTLTILDQIEGSMNNLEGLHKLGGERGLTAAAGNPALTLLNTEFIALIKFELAKKRGK